MWCTCDEIKICLQSSEPEVYWGSHSGLHHSEIKGAWNNQDSFQSGLLTKMEQSLEKSLARRRVQCGEGRMLQKVNHRCRLSPVMAVQHWSGLRECQMEQSPEIYLMKTWSRVRRSSGGAKASPSNELEMLRTAKNNSVDLPQWPSRTSGLNPKT